VGLLGPNEPVQNVAGLRDLFQRHPLIAGMSLGNVAWTKNDSRSPGRRQGSRIGPVWNRHDLVSASHLIDRLAQAVDELRLGLRSLPIERHHGQPRFGAFEWEIDLRFHLHEFRKLTQRRARVF